MTTLAITNPNLDLSLKTSRMENTNLYLKPKYTEEGEFLLDHLRYNDVLKAEQALLPSSLHTVFKLVLKDASVGQVFDNFYVYIF